MNEAKEEKNRIPTLREEVERDTAWSIQTLIEMFEEYKGSESQVAEEILRWQISKSKKANLMARFAKIGLGMVKLRWMETNPEQRKLGEKIRTKESRQKDIDYAKKKIEGIEDNSNDQPSS